ncbi:MAG: DUF1269 domain-containing protein [Chloroflexota bacterium]|nr:DUF1269 domain-containing protein [Chloroflexota bacterium]
MTDEPKKDEAQAPASEGEVTKADDQVVAGVVASEVDPHGATIVAAVGDEDGVKAVVAIDTDYFNTVLAAEFASPDAAKAAYLTLLDAEVNGKLQIDGVLAVHADEAGKIHIDKLTEHSTKTGVKWGAAAGLVVGVLFPPAIIASTVGWGIIGGALGKLRNLHHRNQVADELAGAIGPNNSGIIALVHGAQLAQVKETIPEATKVTTAEIDEKAAKDIAEAAKEADAGEQPEG